jgi:hypothetical protein
LYVLGSYGSNKKPVDTSDVLAESLLSSLRQITSQPRKKIRDIFLKEVEPLATEIGKILKSYFPRETISVVSTLETEMDRYYGVDFLIRIGNDLMFVDVTLQPYARKPIDRKRKSNHYYIRFTEYFAMSPDRLEEFCKDVRDRMDMPYNIFKHAKKETAEKIITILDTYAVT